MESPNPQDIIPPASTPAPSSSSLTNPRHPLPHPFNNTTPPPTLLTQGAESLLYKTHFPTPATPAALKIRPSKPWRHPTLDARLTKQRVLAEARVLVKLGGLGAELRVPAVFSVEWDMARRVKTLDPSQRAERGEGVESGRRGGGGGGGGGGSGAWILMEWIEGWSVKEVLRACDARFKEGGMTEGEKTEEEEEIRILLRRIGRAVGMMHSLGGVVHGDLTTSNVMVRPAVSATASSPSSPAAAAPGLVILKDGYEIVLIDFGLSTQSIQDEDRAVDLYVLERAFGSTHPRQEGLFDGQVMEGYKGVWKGAGVVLRRLEEVRLRGRKRSMLG